MKNYLTRPLACALLFAVISIHAQQKQDSAFLKAKISGKDWQAVKMTYDEYPSEIVQIWGDNGNTSLRLQLNKPAPGKIEQLIKTDLNSWTDDAFNMYGVFKGEIQTTKMDDRWIEGVFHATLKDARTLKTVEVTSGSFRIPNPKSFKH